jgi:CoA:oxalate CoA-transferase
MTQATKGPLSGVVVVDLSRILAGPYCTLLMAEMGARVIKVEPPKGGDDARPTARSSTASRPTSPRSTAARKASRSTSRPRRPQDFEKLLEKADVIVENFRPARWRSWATAGTRCTRSIPKLIYASASGFGHTGPNSKDPPTTW